MHAHIAYGILVLHACENQMRSCDERMRSLPGLLSAAAGAWVHVLLNHAAESCNHACHGPGILKVVASYLLPLACDMRIWLLLLSCS